MQQIIHKMWGLCCDENQVWDRDYNEYVNLLESQHFVNERRRKLGMSVVHRSGIYSDNESMDRLDESKSYAAFNRLVESSSPPWDPSLILKTVEVFREEKQECEVHARGSIFLKAEQGHPWGDLLRL